MEEKRLKVVSYCQTINNNPEWELIGDYAEAEYQKMLEDAKAGKFDMILVMSLAQFPKDIKELLTTVRDLRQHGVAVSFEEEKLDTSALNA